MAVAHCAQADGTHLRQGSRATPSDNNLPCKESLLVVFQARLRVRVVSLLQPVLDGRHADFPFACKKEVQPYWQETGHPDRGRTAHATVDSTRGPNHRTTNQLHPQKPANTLDRENPNPRPDPSPHFEGQ